MKITLLLACIVLGGMQALAMEKIREVPTEEELHVEEKIKLLLQDEKDPAVKHTVELSRRHANLIGSIAQLLEDAELKETGFPLPDTTREQWRLIESHLEGVYAITHNASQSSQLRQGIVDAFQALDGKSLIEVIRTADYLDIPILLEIGLEVAKNVPCEKLSWEQLSLCNSHMRNSIMVYHILAQCGPNLELAKVKRRNDCGMLTARFICERGRVCSGYSGGIISVGDLHGNEFALWQGHEQVVRDFCVAEDDRMVSVSNDKAVRVWNIWDPAHHEIGGIKSHDDIVTCVCLTKNQYIISGSLDKTVRVWNMWSITDNNPLALCRGHEDAVTSVCVSKDKKIVSGSNDATVRIWTLKGEALAVCKGHEKPVTAVCVTDQGKIVSASEDNTVRVWDMLGNLRAVCRGHEASVTGVGITKDGHIVSSSVDKTVRLWDMQGNEVAVCRGYGSKVLSVTVTEEGMIVASCRDGNVYVWDITLLTRILEMNDDTAQALWELLIRHSKESELEKKRLWVDIEKILTDGTLSENT